MRKHNCMAVLLLVLGLSAESSAAAVYKCSVAGKTVYQDRPCVGATAEQNQLELRADPAAPAAASPAEAQESTRAFLARRDVVNLRSALTAEIGRLEQDSANARASMDLELRRLRTAQGTAANNLAGAQYLNSITTEMQAVTQRYQARIDNNEQRIARLQQQLLALPAP